MALSSQGPLAQRSLLHSCLQAVVTTAPLGEVMTQGIYFVCIFRPLCSVAFLDALCRELPSVEGARTPTGDIWSPDVPEWTLSKAPGLSAGCHSELRISHIRASWISVWQSGPSVPSYHLSKPGPIPSAPVQPWPSPQPHPPPCHPSP